MRISEKCPSCQEDQALNSSIERYEYSIRSTLKKIWEVQDHITLNPEQATVNMNMVNGGEQPAFVPCVRAPTISMRKVTNFAALILPSRQMNYVLPDFSTLESHPQEPTHLQQLHDKYQ